MYTETDFNNLCIDIELSIAQVRILGVDVSKYQEYYRQVVREVEATVKKKYASNLEALNCDSEYNVGYCKLVELKNQLNKNDPVFRIYNSSLYIEKQIEGDISPEELLNLVTEMIAKLHSLGEIKELDSFDRHKLLNTIYNVVYKLIKLELLLTGESQLFLYVSNSDINAKFLNVIIANELLAMEGNQELYDRLSKIKDKNYLDLDLIRFIMYKNNELKFNVSLKNRLLSDMEKLQSYGHDMSSDVNTVYSDSNRMLRAILDLTSSKREFRKRSVAFGVALSLLITGFVAIDRFLRRHMTIGLYDATYDTYSTLTGEMVTTKDQVSLIDGTDASVIRLHTGDEYYDLSYDMSSDSYNNLLEYFSENSSEEMYVEVIKKHYDYIKDILDVDSYTPLKLFLYMVYIFLVLFTSSIIDYKFDFSISDIFSIGELVSCKRHKERDDERCKEIAAEGLAAIDRLIDTIVKDEVLKARFEELYEKNKFLLEDEEELQKKIDEILEFNQKALDDANLNTNKAHIFSYKRA